MTWPTLRNVALKSFFLACVCLVLCATQQAEAQIMDLDAYWEEVSRTVREGDFEGYAALYHEDAVLVSAGSATSYSIAQALAGWKKGFDDTKAGKMKADVKFRFSSHFGNENTAHQTGIFRYVSTPKGGEMSEALIHFEALFVKKDGWLMTMEYQKTPATKEEWEALK